MGPRAFDDADDPIHTTSPPGVGWTRVNMSEAMPGIATPLSWSFMDDATERMVRGGYFDMGVLSRALLPAPPDVAGRTASIFYGRVALNIDWSRRCADLQPLTSGDALEAAYFGKVREGRESAPSPQSRRRYPIIFLKSPPLAVRTPRRLRRLYRESWGWWQGVVAAGDRDLPGARAQFVDAKRRFDTIARTHVAAALLGGTLYPLLGSLTAAVGRPELMTSLLGGHQSVEIETTTDLWDVAHGRSTIDEFVRRRGFQGPHQGELSARVWREDRRPVARLAETLRTMGEEADPRRVEQRSVEVRREAERALVAGLPVRRRPWAQAVLRFAHTYVPLRETGKAALMTAFDVARLSARTVGAELERRGVLGDAEDVFYLTMPELVADDVPDARELVAFRRERREGYRLLELPESWVGMVEPRPVEASTTGVVTGLGVSPGVTEGRARVIVDPSTDDLEPGEILVCETTDPSWAAYFLVAAGVVNDIGSAMSHGSIVAREVGIPCVTNTRDGTRVLRTGDLVRVDGGAGTVDVLSRATP